MSEYNYKTSYEPIGPKERAAIEGKTAFAIGIGLFAATGTSEKSAIEVMSTFIGTGTVAYLGHESLVKPILDLIDGDRPGIIPVEDILRRADNNQPIEPK